MRSGRCASGDVHREIGIGRRGSRDGKREIGIGNSDRQMGIGRWGSADGERGRWGSADADREMSLSNKPEKGSQMAECQHGFTSATRIPANWRRRQLDPRPPRRPHRSGGRAAVGGDDPHLPHETTNPLPAIRERVRLSSDLTMSVDHPPGRSASPRDCTAAAYAHPMHISQAGTSPSPTVKSPTTTIRNSMNSAPPTLA